MHPSRPSTLQQKERNLGFYSRLGLYAPFVRVAIWVMRWGMKAGIISPAAFMPPPEAKERRPHFNNRRIRRALKSCFSRAERRARKGLTFDMQDYIPRAYAYLPYITMMDKSLTVDQFKERYIRDNDISRVQMYGLDSAHAIAAFIPGVRDLWSNMDANMAGLFGLSVAAASDPAPP